MSRVVNDLLSGSWPFLVIRACHTPLRFQIDDISLSSFGKELDKTLVSLANNFLKVSTNYSDFQCPDFPPNFSITRTSVIVIPRSIALHMS